jgi:hypothetical protein
MLEEGLRSEGTLRQDFYSAGRERPAVDLSGGKPNNQGSWVATCELAIPEKRMSRVLAHRSCLHEGPQQD